jgi:DNA-binding CsgD family transcriptional regulator
MVAGGEARLIGRDDELARLRGLLEPPPSRGRVLVLLGEAGTGKTALLAAARAGVRGTRVLTVTGRESDRDLAFAGLHELLWPVVDGVAGLPERQAQALGGALALSTGTTAPDALLTGVAVVTLLSELTDGGPVLVVVDDAQWLDDASLDVLAFASRRWDAEPVVVLLGARGDTPPRGFDRDVPTLRLGPLSTADAGRLLDAQPDPPQGRSRQAVLAQALGNPLALRELARAVAADPARGRRRSAEPLPLTDRLTAVVARQLGALPDLTRAALLLAAVADGTDLPAGVAPALDAAALAPAERAGLVEVGPGGVHFSHPLVRAAVYHGVPFADRAAAHRTVAEALRDQPDRRAWHLAAAAWQPDDGLATLLEDSASSAQRRGGAAAAARALERAAELTPPGPEQARRLLAAAGLALAAGQADWVDDLATRALQATDDPDQRIAARLRRGWALVWSNRHAEALEALVSVAREAADRSPVTAWDALGLAATVVYQSGLRSGRALVLDVLDHLSEVAPTTSRSPSHVGEQRSWIRACTDPYTGRTEALAALHRLPAGPGDDLAKIGATAWLLDDSDTAVAVLRRAVDALRVPGTRGQAVAALSALQWAAIDTGRWDEAAAAAREAGDAAAAYRMETVAATADLADATVLALRGDPVGARSVLEASHALADTAEYLSIRARTRHAAGLAALAEGDHAAAYVQLAALFDHDGEPLHHHVSPLAIADLADAAVHAERGPAARALPHRVLARLDPGAGPRLAQLAARARGLLADPAEAGTHFADALADPVGDTWPFERALARLDHGRWLRRQRRINDAKPVLTAALESFRALGARPWTHRAEGELRACGVAVEAASGAHGRLADLTAQQREIVLLAGQGLTNGEIADRLFLSPRTVASHLYRSYPRLGISGRHQLRDIV